MDTAAAPAADEEKAQPPEGTFGRLVRDLREAAGYSQNGLARALGIGQSTISTWEWNTARPNVERMVRLADAIGPEHLDRLSRLAAALDAPET